MCPGDGLVSPAVRSWFAGRSVAGPTEPQAGGLAGDRGWSSYPDRRADRVREDPGGVPGLRRPHLPAAQGERPRPERAAGPQVVHVPLFRALDVDSRATCRRGWVRSRSTRGRMILRPPYRLGKVASDPLRNARDARMNRRPLDPQDCGLGVDAGPPRHVGGAVGAPTCGSSGRAHCVWSPSGPQPSDHDEGGDQLLSLEGAAQVPGESLTCVAGVRGSQCRMKKSGHVGVSFGCHQLLAVSGSALSWYAAGRLRGGTGFSRSISRRIGANMAS